MGKNRKKKISVLDRHEPVLQAHKSGRDNVPVEIEEEKPKPVQIFVQDGISAGDKVV